MKSKKKLVTELFFAFPNMEVFPIISNLFFLVPAAEAVYQKRWTRFMINILIVVNSSMYHACAGFAGACAFDSIAHKHLDFFFAQLTIPLTALYIIDFPDTLLYLERILIIVFAFIIAITQIVWGESNYIQMILAAASLLMIIVYWIVYALTELAKNPDGGLRLPPYDWAMFALGIACLALACNLYSTQLQYHATYWSTHSCWHSVAAMGTYFILMIWPDVKKDAEFKSLDSQLLNLDFEMRKKKVRQWVHLAPRSRI